MRRLSNGWPSRGVMVAALAGLSLLLAVVAGCAGGASAPVSMERAVPEPAMMEASVADEAYSAEMPRKVIANAQLDLVVDDTSSVVESINAAVEELGGYVSQTNLYRDTYGGRNLLRGSLTLRVPVEELESTLAKLEALAIEVRSKSVDRQDVTDQYSDIEAQLRNLEATENELRELLAEVRSKPNATSEDILAVHRDLTEIRGEIERLQGRKNMMDNQISLSTIDVILTPDEANRPVVEESWRPATVVRDAMRALVSTMQFFGSLSIWIGVYLLPILLLALIPLAIIVWGIRKLIQRRRRNRQLKAEMTAGEV